MENKVGYLRRNLLVPIPVVETLEGWNAQLLGLAEGDFQRPHYKKGLTIAELFEEERRHLGRLPEKPFTVERFSRVHTDGYGKFCLDGRHWYSSSPESALQELTVGIRAHSIVVSVRTGASTAKAEATAAITKPAWRLCAKNPAPGRTAHCAQE